MLVRNDTEFAQTAIVASNKLVVDSILDLVVELQNVVVVVNHVFEALELGLVCEAAVFDGVECFAFAAA